MYRTTKKDFEVFKAAARKTIDFYGLLDWEIVFFHDWPEESKQNSRAEFIANAVGRVASVFLSPTCKVKPTGRDLQLSGFHEVSHLLTVSLVVEATARFTAQVEVDTEDHAIIRRLENSVFPLIFRS